MNKNQQMYNELVVVVKKYGFDSKTEIKGNSVMINFSDPRTSWVNYYYKLYKKYASNGFFRYTLRNSHCTVLICRDGQSGISICNPYDIYNSQIGYAVAMAKLLKVKIPNFI